MDFTLIFSKNFLTKKYEEIIIIIKYLKTGKVEKPDGCSWVNSIHQVFFTKCISKDFYSYKNEDEDEEIMILSIQKIPWELWNPKCFQEYFFEIN